MSKSSAFGNAAYLNPQTIQLYRNKFQTVYGVNLTDDEIREFARRLKKITTPAIPCVAVPAVFFVLGLVGIITESFFFGEASIPLFVICFILLCAGVVVLGTTQKKLELNFAEEVKRARPASQAPPPGSYMGSSAPYGQPMSTPYGQQPGPTYNQPPPTSSQVFVKETVIVKVRCQFCGKLVDQGLSECPNCLGKM